MWARCAVRSVQLGRMSVARSFRLAAVATVARHTLWDPPIGPQIAKMYRGLYVHSVGFHDYLVSCVEHFPAAKEVPA